MKWLKSIILFYISFNGFAQCIQIPNSTTTITGLYTSDINFPPASIIYIAPNATVTGNIYLNNSSLSNCGTILSRKIVMKQSLYNQQYTFYNFNSIDCDSLICDTMGHIHNFSIIKAKEFDLLLQASVDNYHTIEAGTIKVKKYSELNSSADVNCQYLSIEDNSKMLNQYANLRVKKLLNIDATCYLYGNMQVCVDSAIINNGSLFGYLPTTYTSNLSIGGISANYGYIANLDICDYTTFNGGKIDYDFGTLSGVTYCTLSGAQCSFYSTEIIEKEMGAVMIGIFPNPVTDVLYIMNNDKYDLDNCKLEIYNSLGQIVFASEVVTAIYIGELANGFYSLRIRQKDGNILYSNFVKR